MHFYFGAIAIVSNLVFSMTIGDEMKKTLKISEMERKIGQLKALLIYIIRQAAIHQNLHKAFPRDGLAVKWECLGTKDLVHESQQLY